MPHVPAHAADLVVDLLEAARCLEKLTPDELRGLLRDAAAVLCELVSPDDCPPEAREAGCSRDSGSQDRKQRGPLGRALLRLVRKN